MYLCIALGKFYISANICSCGCIVKFFNTASTASLKVLQISLFGVIALYDENWSCLHNDNIILYIVTFLKWLYNSS